MALPPISFPVPQRQPSLIEQAFSQILATAAGEYIRRPFDVAKEKRAEKTQIAQEVRQQAARFTELQEQARIALQQARDLADVGFAESVELGKYLEVTPEVEAGLRGQGREFAIFGRDNKRYVPKDYVVGAGPAATGLLGQVTEDIRALRGQAKPAGTTGAATPFTEADVQSVASLLPSAVTAASALATDARQRELAAATKEHNRALQFSQTLSTANWEEVRGRQIIDPVTNKARLHTSDEVRGLVSDPRELQGLAVGDDQYAQMAQRWLTAADKVRDYNVILPALTEEALTETEAEYINDRSLGLMQRLALEAQNVGRDDIGKGVLFRLRPGRKPAPITDADAEGPAFLRGNRPLMRALFASQYYRNMTEVTNANKSPGTARLDRKALGYLEYLMYIRGEPDWDHPEIRVDEWPVELPRPGDQPAATGVSQYDSPEERAAVEQKAIEFGARTTPSPAPGPTPGSGLEFPERAPTRTAPQFGLQGESQQYKEMYGFFYNELVADSTKYQDYLDDNNEIHSSLQSAVKHYRDQGLSESDSVMVSLTTGNSGRRQLALDRLRRTVERAIKHANDARRK